MTELIQVFKVKIIKCDNKFMWYRNMTGQIFETIKAKSNGFNYTPIPFDMYKLKCLANPLPNHLGL